MFDYQLNPNIIIGFGLAFLVMGLINIIKPNLLLFSVKGNPKQTRNKGIIRIIMAIVFIVIYFYRTQISTL